MNTTKYNTALEYSEELFSKRPTDEQVQKIREIDGSDMKFLKLLGDYPDTFWHFTNPGYFVKNALFWVKYHNEEIENEQDYVFSLESLGAYMMETDEYCRRGSDGKLYIPFELQESLKEHNRLIKNAKQRIRRLEDKKKWKQREADNAMKYIEVFNSIGVEE